MVRPIGYEQNRHPGWELIDMLDAMSASGLKVVRTNKLIPDNTDYLGLTYTGANLTGIVCKQGGVGGITLATLTLAYTGAVLDSITKT
jgi:hypothetical protein